MSILKTGDKAPAFEAKDQNGELVKLTDLSGKKVILYFYPKDLTPGCTAESCNLRDHYTELKNNGFEVVGVSADDEKKHRKFIEKYDLPFTLLADTDKKVCEAYGVWGEKKFMGRTFLGIKRVTYVIDEKGFILHVLEKVKTETHAEQMLEELGALTN